MQNPKYQVAFWISSADKTKTEDLKKQHISQYDIYVAGLESLFKKCLTQNKKK